MPRVKRGVPAAKRRKRILKRAKGYFGGRSKLHSVAVEAVEKADTYRGDAPPLHWLYGLTTRHCLARLRDARRRRELLDEVVQEEPADSLDQTVEWVEERRRWFEFAHGEEQPHRQVGAPSSQLLLVSGDCLFVPHDRRADGDAGGHLVVEQPADPPVEEPCNLRTGVDPTESELRVGTHLRCFARLGHETLTEGDHHRVVLGEGARQVPQRLAQGVG